MIDGTRRGPVEYSPSSEGERPGVPVHVFGERPGLSFVHSLITCQQWRKVYDMLPMKAIRLTLGENLAASVPIWDTDGPCVIRLIAAPFTPSENLVTADVTFATFTGSA